MQVNRMIDELGGVLRMQVARAREVQQLPAERLLKRPAPEAWNALEVFEHMVLSTGVYVRGLEAVFAREAGRLAANPEFSPGLLGNWFTKGMLPKPDGSIRNKMRTMKMFDPGRQHGASSASIDRFIDLCERMLSLLDQSRTTDLNRMRVVSSLGPIIRFKAGDAFRFPLAHQQRHFLQVERLLRG